MNKNKNLLEKISNGRQFRNMVDFRISEDNNEMVVEGHACTFNQPYCLYDDGEYRIEEQIDPHSFDECDMSDVIMQYNHEGRVYARTRNNTLSVFIDAIGLAMRALLHGTEAGKELYEEIKGGYTDRMSFGFRVKEDSRTVTRDSETGKVTVLRTIKKISKLYDVSAVSIPANDGTDISARSYCNGLIEELKAERLDEERASLRLLQEETLAFLSL